MKWQGHPFLMATSPDSITGRAFLSAIASGDKDLDSVFDAYYKYPANAKKYASRIQSDEKYWNKDTARKVYYNTSEPVLKPITEKPDATAVRKTIAKSKRKARWSGAENVSPYLTGKPILKVKKDIKLPTAAEVAKKSEWKSPMGFKNGKLPGYRKGKGVDMGQKAQDVSTE